MRTKLLLPPIYGLVKPPEFQVNCCLSQRPICLETRLSPLAGEATLPITLEEQILIGAKFILTLGEQK